MTILERYNAALDERAAAMRAEAAAARQSGDERRHSLFLMQASMLGDMLKQLGKVEHNRIRAGILQSEIDFMTRQAASFEARGDFDAADQARVKADTIRWAQDALRRLEAEGDE
ncbi:MAG: hypothetical protein J5602_08410 [Clostridia bacterium]|nr:hypothetical protein [Clostridia bacterium]MBO4885322.1 hypothetical protein [Clostridia bacterium]